MVISGFGKPYILLHISSSDVSEDTIFNFLFALYKALSDNIQPPIDPADEVILPDKFN